jgi:hypothetical protein
MGRTAFVWGLHLVSTDHRGRTRFWLSIATFVRTLVGENRCDEEAFFSVLAAVDGLMAAEDSAGLGDAAEALRAMPEFIAETIGDRDAVWAGRCWSAGTLAWLAMRRLGADRR